MPNKPRGHYIRELHERYPDWNGLVDMIEAAQKAQAALDAREAASSDPKEHGDGQVDPPTIADYNMVQQLHERPLKFLLPQLKATEISVGEAGGGLSITIHKPDGK